MDLTFRAGYGANGMPVSAIAAEIVTAVLGARHRYRDTFSFNR
ncbi:MAG: hypothetical protein WD802_10385 [Gemmatimonadaceae bacterium]